MGWEYLLLFKGGRRLLTEIETALKSSCAMSSVVKFCAFLSCPACEQHEIKKYELLLPDHPLLIQVIMNEC